MAKNVKGGTVEVTVSDKGSLKKLGKDARKAGKDMGSVARSTAESDRRLKSLSNQTSNSSKAFSKQAQTIQGGLVPVYATLAAQVFAVSAAFRFLQDSVNFRNLVAGQAAYGAATGTMFSVIAKSVRNASNSLISYQDASQAVAIGTAAGLNASQMERLGKAASDVSLALGRDVVDSFNRLVRGVTKAEPELLDELGIILRLDPALKQYAATLGKSKEDLNQFERAQAVTNFVLDQAESKFGKISQVVSPTAFALGQFQQAFNDMLNDLQIGIAGVVDFVAPFFTQNIQAFAAALLIFITGVVKTMLPNYDMIVAQGAKTVTALKAQVKEIESEIKILGQARLIKSPAQAGALRKEGLAQVQSVDPSIGSLSQQQISARLRPEHLKKIEADKVAIYKDGLEKMQRANQYHKGKEALVVETTETKKQLAQKKTTLKHEQELLRQERRQAASAKFMIAAFRAIYIAGFTVMILQAAKAFVYFTSLSEKQRLEHKQMTDDAKELADKLADINKNLGKMIELRDKFLVDSPFTQFARALQTMDIKQQLADISMLRADNIAQGQDYLNQRNVATGMNQAGDLFGNSQQRSMALASYLTMGKNWVVEWFDFSSEAAIKSAESVRDFESNLDRLMKISPDPAITAALEDMKTEFKKTGEVSATTIANFDKLQKKLIETEQSARQFNQTSMDLQKGLVGLAQQFAPKTTFMNIQSLVDTNREAMRNELSQLTGDIKHFSGFEYLDVSLIGGSAEEIKNLYLQMGIHKNVVDTLVQRTVAYQDQRGLLLELQPILDDNLIIERGINLELAENKATRAGIVQDGSLMAAQATRMADETERELKIRKSLTIESSLEKMIKSEKIQKDKVLLELLKHALELQKQTTKELQLQHHLASQTEATRRAGLQNALQTSQDTIAPFSMAHMFGMTKPITEGQIDNTIAEHRKKTGLEMTREEAIQNLQRFNAQLSFTEMQMNLINNLSTSIGTALVDGLANAFVEVAKGTMTFADAFRNMTIEILAQIAAMTMKMAIFKALAGFFVTPTAPDINMDAMNFGGGFTNSMGGAGFDDFGFNLDYFPGTAGRYGGIMSSPGYRSFGRGGIATGPDSGYAATLHGTEAVVPLGNDRSIPVELKGAGGGINNITVNVNGGTTSGGQSPEQAKALGNMIQVATMEIIQREKRPGGVLSR